MKKNSVYFQLGSIIFVGLCVRLILAYVQYGTQDVDAYEYYSTFWRDNKSPYDGTNRWNYTPVWFWIISGCGAIARAMRLPFSFVIKWPLVIADLAILILMVKSCRKWAKDSKDILAVAAIYFLNPVSIFLTGYHGQFDTVSLVFLLGAWYAVTFYQSSSRGWGLVFLASGVAVKHFNILLLPVFAFVQNKKIWSGLYLTVPIITFLALLLPFYIVVPQVVWHDVLSYNLGAGYWGWSGVICRTTLLLTGFDIIQQPWFGLMRYFNFMLYGIIFVASYVFTRKRDLLDSIIGIFLLFYVFTVQMAPQYTLWILPFACLRRNRYLYFYTLFGAIQLWAFFYSHTHWYFNQPFEGIVSRLIPKLFVISRYLTWGVCVLWLGGFIREKKAVKE